MNLEEIKMVVFDMAGTTIAEGKTVYQAVASALRLIGLNLSRDDIFMAIGGMNKTEGIALLIKQYAPDTAQENVEKINKEFLKILMETYSTSKEIKPFPGAEELFEELHKKRIKVVLNTGYNRGTVNLLMDRLQWTDSGLIDLTISSDEVESGRPAPHMIHKAMQHFGIDTAEKVMKVGDTASDMREGKNAGCRYIVGIESEMYSAQQLRDVGATHSIKHLMEVVDDEKSLA